MYFAAIISKNVKMLRKKYGMSQQELARLTRLSVRYISRLETSSPNITVDIIERLAKAFGCSYYQILQDHNIIAENKADITKIFDDIINSIQQLKTLQFLYCLDVLDFKKICDYIPKAIILVDQEHNIIYLNLSAKNLFKCENENVIGKNIYNIFIPENYANSYKAIFEKYKTNNVANLVIEFKTHNINQDVFKAETFITSVDINSQIFTIFLIKKLSEDLPSDKKDVHEVSLSNSKEILKADGIIFINLDKKTFKICSPDKCVTYNEDLLKDKEYLLSQPSTDVVNITPSSKQDLINNNIDLKSCIYSILDNYISKGVISSDSLYVQHKNIKVYNHSIIDLNNNKILILLYKYNPITL